MYKSLTFGEPLDAEDARHWKRYKIMQRMGWTYWEYQKTPAHFVDEIWAMMTTEAKAQADMIPNGAK